MVLLNLECFRDRYAELTVEIAGDVSARKLSFAILDSTTKPVPTDNVLVSKKNDLAGGDDDTQLDATYSTTTLITTLTIYMYPDDLADQTQEEFYCDIYSEDATDSLDKVQIASGFITCKYTAQNQLNGITTPSTAVRVLAMECNAQDATHLYPRYNNSTGKLDFLTLAQLKSDLGI